MKSIIELAKQAWVGYCEGKQYLAFTEDELQRFAALVRAAALAEQQAEPVAWMPIETAPKGRIVLVHYKNQLSNGRTMRARYYLPETLDSDTTESGWADEGWYEESETYEYLMPLDGEPTHWMPLPQEPGLYTAPQPAKPCPTCEALARAVMLDQTGAA